MKSLIAVMLALFALAGCGSIGLQSPFVSKELSTRVPARVAKAPAVTTTSADAPMATEPSTQTQVEIASFPSSKNPTKGKKWTEMGLFPYKGTTDQAISQMPLDTRQKGRLKAMFASGECSRYEIKTGEKFAVDWLNFTAGGVHKNRTYIAADLKKLPSRMVTICSLGDGVYAGQFDGCKNFFVSISTAPQQDVSSTALHALPGVAAPGVCPSGRILILHLWDRNKLPGDLQARLDAVTPQESAFRSVAFSRAMGGELRARSGRGEFNRSEMSAKVLPVLMDDSGNRLEELPVGVVKSGTLRWHFPSERIEGKTVSLIFPDSGMVSPPIGANKQRELRVFWTEWGDICTMNVHAAHR